MTDERWQSLVGNLKDNLEVTDHYFEDFSDTPGEIEVYEVRSPLGLIKVSRLSHPRQISAKAIYSKRGNSVINIQHDYDMHDIIHTLLIEKYDSNSGTWQELSADTFKL